MDFFPVPVVFVDGQDSLVFRLVVADNVGAAVKHCVIARRKLLANFIKVFLAHRVERAIGKQFQSVRHRPGKGVLHGMVVKNFNAHCPEISRFAGEIIFRSFDVIIYGVDNP